MRHLPSQPSPSSKLPSSHCSPRAGSHMPLPQDGPTAAMADVGRSASSLFMLLLGAMPHDVSSTSVAVVGNRRRCGLALDICPAGFCGDCIYVSLRFGRVRFRVFVSVRRKARLQPGFAGLSALDRHSFMIYARIARCQARWWGELRAMSSGLWGSG